MNSSLVVATHTDAPVSQITLKASTFDHVVVTFSDEQVLEYEVGDGGSDTMGDRV